MTEKPRTEMRNVAISVALTFVSLTTAWSQAPPTTQDGSMSGAQPPAAAPRPKPYPDGSYDFAPGMTGPKIAEAVTAFYPAPPADGTRVYCVFQIVVAADGTASVIGTLHSGGEAFDAAAIDALKQSKFVPGTLDNHPVPVRTRIRFIFFPDERPAPPLIFPSPAETDANQRVRPPTVLHAVDPAYSEEGRRKKIKGIVVVALRVDEQGVPTNVHVVRSLGYGLDEKAIHCVSQYRFRPATKDGKPVATDVNIEVNFQIY